MIKRMLPGTLRVVGGMLAGAAIVLLLLGWRLSSGPISLAFLTPRVEAMLSDQHDRYDFRIKELVLIWAGWDRKVDLRFLDAEIIDKTGITVGAIPELSVELSVRALLNRTIAPKSIDFFSPVIDLVRKEEGGIGVEFSDSGADTTSAAIRFLSLLANPPNNQTGMSYLSRLTIHDADLTLYDEKLETEWRVPNARATFEKTPSGLEGWLTGDIQTGPDKANLSILGSYSPGTQRIDLGVSFSNFMPSRFAGFSPELRPLESINLPLQGTITLTARNDGHVESIGFDVLSTQGLINRSQDLPADLNIQSLQLKGQYSGAAKVFEIEHLGIDLGADGFVPIPELDGQRIPLKNLALTGRYEVDQDQLVVPELKLELGGPAAEADLKIKNLSSEQPRVIATASVTDIPLDDAAIYWPQGILDDARDWTLSSLSVGKMSEMRIEADINMDMTKREPSVNSLSGTMRMDNVTIDYLDGMTPLTGASGTAKLTDTELSVYARDGVAGDLQVPWGAAFLTDLDTDIELADIELQIEGPIVSVLTEIDRKPLEFAKEIELDRKTTRGDTAIQLTFAFPLRNDLSFDDIEVTAKATMTNMAVKEALLDIDLTEGNLRLDANGERIKIDGDAKLANIPTVVSWVRNFDDAAPFRERFDVDAIISGMTDLKDFGLQIEPFRGDIVDGVVDTKLRYVEFDDKLDRMEVTAELGQVAISIPEIGWKKEKAQPGSAKMVMLMDQKSIKEIPSFSVETGDLEVRGSVAYSDDFEQTPSVTFDRVGFKNTDIVGDITPRGDGGWAVSIQGKSFDLEPLWKEFLYRRAERKELGAENTGDTEEIPSLALVIDVDRVRLDDDRFLDDFSGRFIRQGDLWRTVRMKSVLGDEGPPLILNIEPDGNDGRSLKVEADDAGAALRALGIYEHMVGGELLIEGRFDDTDPQSPLRGELTVNSFRIVNAPILAHVVSILSLTGIIDALRGDGLGFSSLTVPFEVRDEVVTLTDARSNGMALGWTGAGTFNTDTEVIDLQGTLVPAYAINAALGYIPFVGRLFTGGERGGGIFAANYRVSGVVTDPEIEVNQMSTLAPSFLRRLFRPSGGTNTSSAPNETEATDEPAPSDVEKTEDDGGPMENVTDREEGSTGPLRLIPNNTPAE